MPTWLAHVCRVSLQPPVLLEDRELVLTEFPGRLRFGWRLGSCLVHNRLVADYLQPEVVEVVIPHGPVGVKLHAQPLGLDRFAIKRGLGPGRMKLARETFPRLSAAFQGERRAIGGALQPFASL